MLKRLLAVLAASFALAYFMPLSAGSAGLAAGTVVAAVLLLAVAAQRVLARRERLFEAVALELDSLGRIHHLGKSLATESRHRQWFTDLHGCLHAYLTAFDKKSFSQYKEMQGQFRKLSMHLNQIASLESEKERALYADLREAARHAADARQRIQSLWNGRILAPFSNMLIGIALVAALAVLAAMGPSDRYVAALALAVLGGGVLFTREADVVQAMKGEELSERYVAQMASLETSQHE